MEPALRAKLHSTKGGFIDTELKELAVKPISPPSVLRAVTMVTPVANMPKAARNSEAVNVGGNADVAVVATSAVYEVRAGVFTA